MKIKRYVSALCATFLLGMNTPAHSLTLPLLGDLSLVSEAPLQILSTVDSLLLSTGIPVLSDLPVIGTLPIIDGRGIPVLRGLEEGVRLGLGVVDVAFANPKFSNSLFLLGTDESALTDALLSGDIFILALPLDGLLPL
jgi:hypothetical protein